MNGRAAVIYMDNFAISVWAYIYIYIYIYFFMFVYIAVLHLNTCARNNGDIEFDWFSTLNQEYSFYFR